ncbi:TPA: outer membrane protein assembly factor BamE [Neisseria weaveri]
MNKLAAILLISFLTACAGTNFKWDNARQIKQGMTEQEVVNLLGTPTMTTSRSDGLVYVWSHANGMTGSVKSVSVVFQDGKVVSVPNIPANYR